jgi:hypothetical protein
MRYPLVKVLVTVSPFRPALSPKLNLFSQPPRPLSPLSTAFTPNRALTPLPSAFTQNDRHGGYRPAPSAFLCALCDLCGKFIVLILLQTLSPLLTLFLQLPSFLFNSLHTLLQNTRGGGCPTHSQWLGVSVAIDFFPVYFQGFTNPSFSNSFTCTSIQNHGGVHPAAHFDSRAAGVRWSALNMGKRR